MSGTRARPIVVVDDDTAIREALIETLTDEGYDAIGIPNGPGLFTYLGGNAPPSVVLLDWNMRPMNGAEVMRELGRQPAWASIPVLLLTADTRADEKMKADRFVGFLRKPVDVTELFRLIKQYAIAR
jgi:CheY-like chemotaxis protein